MATHISTPMILIINDNHQNDTTEVLEALKPLKAERSVVIGYTQTEALPEDRLCHDIFILTTSNQGLVAAQIVTITQKLPKALVLVTNVQGYNQGRCQSVTLEALTPTINQYFPVNHVGHPVS